MKRIKSQFLSQSDVVALSNQLDSLKNFLQALSDKQQKEERLIDSDFKIAISMANTICNLFFTSNKPLVLLAELNFFNNTTLAISRIRSLVDEVNSNKFDDEVINEDFVIIGLLYNLLESAIHLFEKHFCD